MILLCQFLAWLWSLPSKLGPCRHLHYREIRSFTTDGTPWVVFECKGCDRFDRGHVHGPSRGEPGSEDWEGVTET